MQMHFLEVWLSDLQYFAILFLADHGDKFTIEREPKCTEKSFLNWEIYEGLECCLFSMEIKNWFFVLMLRL